MRALLLAVLLACSNEPPAPSSAPREAPATTVKDPATARKLLAAGAPAIDVRTPAEFAGEHLPRAINLPVDHIRERLAEVDRLVDGDRARAIVVYCAKGGRAATAKRALEDAGFTHVVNGGGLADLR